jgi:hypothetical protein
MVGRIMLKQITVKQVVVEPALADFDYNAEAELFPGRNKKSSRRPTGYRRFEHAADAIRFAIEELAPEFLLGAYLEVDEERYDSGGIRRLYESVNYPLIRGAAIDPQDLQPAQEQDLNHGAKFSKSKPLV